MARFDKGISLTDQGKMHSVPVHGARLTTAATLLQNLPSHLGLVHDSIPCPSLSAVSVALVLVAKCFL